MMLDKTGTNSRTIYFEDGQEVRRDPCPHDDGFWPLDGMEPRTIIDQRNREILGIPMLCRSCGMSTLLAEEHFD